MGAWVPLRAPKLTPTALMVDPPMDLSKIHFLPDPLFLQCLSSFALNFFPWDAPNSEWFSVLNGFGTLGDLGTQYSKSGTFSCS